MSEQATCDLSNVTIKNGKHTTREEGMCVMEAVAFAANEPHSDHPQCACPALGAYARRLNDAYWLGGDDERTKALRPAIMALVGSRSTDEVYWRRGFFFADCAVRELAPLALESRADRRERWKQPEAAALLREVALKLRAVPEIVDKASALAAMNVALGLRDDLRKRRDEAWRRYAAAAAADADAAAADARLRILRRAAEILVEATRITSAPSAAVAGDQKPETSGGSA